MSAAELRIRTPEGIAFAYELAGPVVRCLAWAIDGAVLLAAFLGLSLGFGAVGILSPDLSQAALIAGWFTLSFGYSIAFEWLWRGQTIGKKVLRLRVMDADGLRLQFHQVVMRNLVRVADALPAFYLVGGIACLLSRKAQRLGDLAAGTIVVHHRQRLEPDLEQLLGTKFNSLRAQVHLCARLRQRTCPAEARLALRALMRRDEFEPSDRVRLFGEIATHFKSLVHFPPEVLETLPDEQFIRNVVDILFRTSEPKPRRAPEQVEAAGV